MKTSLALACLLFASCVYVETNSCSDGITNGTESDIDCGGACAACAVGRGCLSNVDCATNFCNRGICSTVTTVPTCTDGLRNGNESDIDCGGSCGLCGLGRVCTSSFDCASNFCSGGICATVAVPSCTDGVQNGSESDVDCGGSCPACLPGRFCAVPADCTSQLCTAQRCLMPATSSLPPVATTYFVDAAASTVIASGSQPGYGITANDGGSFRLVWTGDGGSAFYSQFYGSVWTTGTFVSVTPGCAGNGCALESSDYLSAPYSVVGGQRFDFDSYARDGVDGVDFIVSTEPAYFDLYIDGQRYPQLVFFTSSGVVANTAALPFGLSIQ